jgi:anthranilate phosphoribosyltransferase
MAIRDQIIQLARGADLTSDEAAAAMDEMMSGVATPAQIAAYLTALHLKGETDAEIAGMARVMRDKATPVDYEGALLDTCGTGGDSSGTFNISTTAAFVAAGAGATVAKHGNRAMSGVCGSADLLEGLGVTIELDPGGVARCLRDAGIGFMFAPRFHPSMRYAGPVRREIGIRTAFNILGPLTNPAHARHQLLGVADAQLAEKLANALALLGTDHALVVHGHGGLDELALSGTNVVYEVHGGDVRRYEISATELGLKPAAHETVLGGDRERNIAITRAILQGEEDGPPADIVVLNSAAALVAADMAGSLREGVALARESLNSGAAHARLERMVVASRAG